MDRLVNLVLISCAIAALVVGAVVLGRTVRDDSLDRLTESIPAEAAAATADSQLRAAVFSANAYFMQHSTYAGMTAESLRKEVDAGLASEVVIKDATASAYCVETEVAKLRFSYRVRKGFLTPGHGC